GEVKCLGAYNEYVFADEKICYKATQRFDLQKAVTLPLASTTAWLELFSSRCLNIKGFADKSPVLVWADLVSMTLLLTICSPRPFETCKTIGADWTLDYRDREAAEKVKAEIPSISRIFSCIVNETSLTQECRTIRRDGGVLCTARPGKANTENVATGVKVTNVLVLTSLLKNHYHKDMKFLASTKVRELLHMPYSKLPEWLESGKMIPSVPHQIPGGLSAVKESFQM
ncbi:hypothetical protein BJ878DRAFT_417478, partial [Calycina marina]